MKLQQLRLFNDKSDFNPESFDSEEYKKLFSKITLSINEAFNAFSNIDITIFDSTTRANMLNNCVVEFAKRNCDDQLFSFYSSLSSTRRCCVVLNNEYLLFFKKHPVSNLKTKQDDLIKNQELDKHVIFVAYHVDIFWSSISRIELQYFSSPNNMTYSYDITHLGSDTLTIKPTNIIPPNPTSIIPPKVALRKELLKSRKIE